MRPYLIPKTQRWVDLDTIQEIREPVFVDRMGSGGYFIELRWQHAFRDDDSVQRFRQDAVYGHDEYSFLQITAPKLGPDGQPDQLAVIRHEVFEPFLYAWTRGEVRRVER